MSSIARPLLPSYTFLLPPKTRLLLKNALRSTVASSSEPSTSRTCTTVTQFPTQHEWRVQTTTLPSRYKRTTGRTCGMAILGQCSFSSIPCKPMAVAEAPSARGTDEATPPADIRPKIIKQGLRKHRVRLKPPAPDYFNLNAPPKNNFLEFSAEVRNLRERLDAATTPPSIGTPQPSPIPPCLSPLSLFQWLFENDLSGSKFLMYRERKDAVKSQRKAEQILRQYFPTFRPLDYGLAQWAYPTSRWSARHWFPEMGDLADPAKDATLAQKEETYMDSIESLFPPHLRKNRPKPMSPLQDDTSETAHLPIDIPWPDIFSPLSSSIEHEYSGNQEDFSIEQESVWEEMGDVMLSVHLLNTIERARDNGVDIISKLLDTGRDRLVFWLVRRLVEPAAGWDDQLDIWRGANLLSGRDRSPQGDISKTIADVIARPFERRHELEALRQRRGIGVVLGSLMHMLVNGWRKEQEETAEEKRRESGGRTKEEEFIYQSIFQTPLFLDHEALVPEVLPGINMSSQETFSTAARIIAFLHSGNHVTPLVYSKKHLQLNQHHDEIMKTMADQASVAFEREIGFRLLEGIRHDDAPVDWALWLDLVSSMASERGLGVSACEIINATGHHAQWVSDKEFAYTRKIGNQSKRQQQLARLEMDVPEDYENRLLLSKSILFNAKDALLYLNASDCPDPEGCTRMLRLLALISKTVNGFSPEMISTFLLTHPGVDLQKSGSEHILEINVHGGWDIKVWYEILFGMIARIDKEGVIDTWRRLELRVAHVGDQSFGDEVEYTLSTYFEGPEDVHPVHVLEKLLKHLRQNETTRPHLIRYIMQKVLPQSSLSDRRILDQLLSYAAATEDHELADYLSPHITSSVEHTAVSSLLNMHLRLRQVQQAEEVYTAWAQRGVIASDVDLGIVVSNAFRRSYKEGLALIDAAVDRQAKSALLRPPRSTLSKPFSVGHDVSVKDRKEMHDGIGAAAWSVMLNATIDRNDRERSQQALNGLGIRLDDFDAVSKMGNHVFCILLKGVVARKGSLAGKKIFEAYCVRPVLHADTNSDGNAQRAEGRNVVGVLEHGRQAEVREFKKTAGRVVPNAVTLYTVMHQAVRERRDFLKRQSVLKMSRKRRTRREQNMVETGVGMGTEWVNVLQWGRKVWTEMGLTEEGWRALMATDLRRYASPARLGNTPGGSVVVDAARLEVENARLEDTNLLEGHGGHDGENLETPSSLDEAFHEDEDDHDNSALDSSDRKEVDNARLEAAKQLESESHGCEHGDNTETSLSL